MDNLFRDEHVKLDVQLGLLHMVLRVLQRYGEDLTRGWQPLLSLLAAAAESKETSVVTLGWECMHLLCYDYLHMMPKVHTSRALEVLASYAKQVRNTAWDRMYKKPFFPLNCVLAGFQSPLHILQT